METINIYFETTLEFTEHTALKSEIAKVALEKYRENRDTYIDETISEIIESEVINDATFETSEHLPYDTERDGFELQINEEPRPDHWLENGPPPLSFKVSMEIKSFVYKCLKVIDEKTFIVVDPHNKYIKRIEGHSAIVIS